MRRTPILVIVLAIAFIFTFSQAVSAEPAIEFKELTVPQIINLYFSGRDLDGIEGLWIYKGIKGPVLMAVISAAVPDIGDQYGTKKGFVGIQVQPDSIWDKGEDRFLIKKSITPHQEYSGSWQMYWVNGYGMKFKANTSATYALGNQSMVVTADNLGQWEMLRLFPGRNPRPGINGTGSGFFISPTLVVTNHHVIDSAKKVEIRNKDGQWVPAKVLVYDEEHDTAILEVLGLEKEVKPIVIGDIASAKVGQRVYSFGFPAPDRLSDDISAMQLRMNEGIIASLQGYKGSDKELQISIPTFGGNSGGPVVNSYGEAMGIVSATLLGSIKEGGMVSVPQNINFAMKMAKAVELVEQLERGRELSHPGQTRTEMKPETMAEQALYTSVLVRTEGYWRAKVVSTSLLKLSK